MKRGFVVDSAEARESMKCKKMNGVSWVRVDGKALKD